MKNKNKVKILAITLIILSVIVILGWIFNIDIFKNISSNSISMKLLTAFLFFLSGFVLYFINEDMDGKRKLSNFILPLLAYMLILITVTLLISIPLGIKTGLEDLFIKEAPGGVATVFPGMPPIQSMLCFLLIAILALITLFHPVKLKKIFKLSGEIILIFGVVSLLGYVFNIPFLYYLGLKGIGNPVAIYTSMFTIITGFGFIFLSRINEN